MQIHQTYETDNIAYWSNRAPGYSEVNRNELSSGQRRVMGRHAGGADWRAYAGAEIPEKFPFWISAAGPDFFPLFWLREATG